MNQYIFIGSSHEQWENGPMFTKKQQVAALHQFSPSGAYTYNTNAST
jgi:hypothetical protein